LTENVRETPGIARIRETAPSYRSDCGFPDRVEINLIVLEIDDGLESLSCPCPKKGQSLRCGDGTRSADGFDPHRCVSGVLGRLPKQVASNASIRAC
jgi:hypothetical protein